MACSCVGDGFHPYFKCLVCVLVDLTRDYDGESGFKHLEEGERSESESARDVGIV